MTQIDFVNSITDKIELSSDVMVQEYIEGIKHLFYKLKTKSFELSSAYIDEGNLTLFIDLKSWESLKSFLSENKSDEIMSVDYEIGEGCYTLVCHIVKGDW